MACAAYALYNAFSNKKQLEEQGRIIDDIGKDNDEISKKVDDLLIKTSTLLDKDLAVTYTMIFGRPTDMNKLSASLHFTITNKSTENTYIVRGIQFLPILGTTFGNISTQKLFNLYWKTGRKVAPGGSINGRIAYNNLNLDKETFGLVYGTIDHMFRAAEGWDKLRDKYATIQNGCEADIFIRANAPYIDAARDYIVQREAAKGDLMWHGGNYLPGSTPSEQGNILTFDEARQVFKV